MRGVLRGLAVAAMVLALGGCTVTWQEPEPEFSPVPVPRVPVVGGCMYEWSDYSDHAAQPCDERHLAEIIEVRTGAGMPLDPKSRAQALAGCRAKADAHLRGTWWRQRVGVRLGLPGKEARRAGASWYSCELRELAQVSISGSQPLYLPHSTRLSDSAAPERRVIRCAQLDTDAETLLLVSLREVDCREPHNAELAGFIEGPLAMDYPSTKQLTGRYVRRKLSDQCRRDLAGFVSDPRLRYDFWPAQVAGADDWELGDHGVRCFVWLGERTVTGSLHR
ncbi:septum formation family protein [Catellatospora sichuanensis]|uniref:septum formation family protein n=1 Tax=Catellatospora sichuanensis TaxID=1969805 RepID=UPI0011825745|nr:septum formation family protein [Catellatospora sichuanensis]